MIKSDFEYDMTDMWQDAHEPDDHYYEALCTGLFNITRMGDGYKQANFIGIRLDNTEYVVVYLNKNAALRNFFDHKQISDVEELASEKLNMH